MAASQQHVHHMHHHPHDQHHAVYAPPSEYTAGGAYAMPYTHEEAPSGSANNKRKRVKKERDDDWAPMPPPAPSSSSMVYASGANDMPMHMAVPTILHRSGSAGTVTTAPPQYEAAYASHSETNNGPAHTIFSEAPVVIESFTEIERRKAAAAAAPSASASSTGADLSQLLHADQPASATSTPKNKANGVALWNGRGVSSGTMSVYDVFFPATTRLKEGGSNSKNGVRESKRRRRNNGDAAERSSTRASHRRTAPADDSLEVDMLRFTVDSFKLIPQGLVDRIDTRLRPSVVATLIANHVENWIKRAGFDDQNFLQEITTLLNVYYPCSHPTILDDVLVAFVFKRPELMERMITKSIIERLQKAGESATPSKYPIIESFARRCSMAQRGGIRRRDVARHDLACLTVLRLLLERNTEKFMLSSWIASCASCCSDVVLSSMWTALLRPLIPTGGKLQAECWNVRDPLDQVFELLREEKQLARYADGDTCKLSMTLITKIVQDPVYSDLRGTPVACEAFEIFFGRPTNSSRLIETWIATEEERDKISREDALRKVMNVTIEHCARLSVKKTNWFIRHVLGFVLGASTQRIFGELIVDHAGLLLGGVDKNEMEEAQGLANEVCEGENGKSSSKGVVVIGNVSSNEKNAEAGVVVQLGVFLDALRSVPEKDGVPVVHAWADKWCIPEVFVPWSYIWAVVSSAITIEVSESTVSPSVNVAFRDFACQLAKHYVANLLRREEAARYLPRVTRILNATIQQLPKGSSVSLLESVLVAVSSLSKSSPLAEKAYNIIAATLAGQISTRRQAVRGVIVESMGQRVAFLHTVDSFVSRQDPVGRLVRDQLIRRRRIGKIILEVLQDGDEVEAGAAVKIMMSAVGGGLECQSEGSGFWATSTIEAIVALGYRVRLPGTRRGAISLLHALSVGGGVSKQSLLWTVLRLCTNYCCGCSTESSAVQATNSARVQVYDAAFEFADLTKLMLQRAPRDMFADVGDFIHQQIRSCGPSKAQWNYYLVLVLDRVVQLGWSLMASSPKLVHVVLTPFDSVYPVARLQDQIVQLRVLKSLCVVLLAASSNQQTARKDASWLPVARTLVSNPLALKIKAISAQRGCLTSSVLAQSIAVLCEDIKQTIEVKGYF